MSNRDNKAAAAEFRELFGIDFDEFTRQAPVKLLLALAEFAEPIDVTVLRFAEEWHPLFQQQRERLARALRHGWQLKAPDIAERRRQMTEVVRGGGVRSRDEEVGGREVAAEPRFSELFEQARDASKASFSHSWHGVLAIQRRP